MNGEELKRLKDLEAENQRLKKMYSELALDHGILGLAFKENTGDTRNSRVIDVYNELISFGLEVDVYDPLAKPIQAKNEYGIDLLETLDLDQYPTILLAVVHDAFKGLSIATSKDRVVYDLKGILPRDLVDKRL